MKRKVKLGVVGTLLAVIAASVGYAWVASNTLSFYTYVSSGTPISLTKSQDLPGTMYYEEPFIFFIRTQNLASKEYDGCYTHFKIWQDGGSMQLGWVTVHYNNTADGGSTDVDVTLTLDGSNNLVGWIGPWDANYGYDAYADINVTIHSGAAVGVYYHLDIWVEV